MRDSGRNVISFNSKTSSAPIVIDPFSFLIGGLGALGVGSVADEYYYRQLEDRRDNDFPDSALRSLLRPVKYAIRFAVGGFVYVLMDNVILKVFNTRAPYAAGAVTGLFVASHARSRAFWGCILGMAVFCQVAEYIYMQHR